MKRREPIPDSESSVAVRGQSAEKPPFVEREISREFIDGLRRIDEMSRRIRRLPNGAISMDEGVFDSPEFARYKEALADAVEFIAQHGGPERVLPYLHRVDDASARHGLLVLCCNRIALGSPESALESRLREEHRLKPHLDDRDVTEWKGHYRGIYLQEAKKRIKAKMTELLSQPPPQSFLDAYAFAAAEGPSLGEAQSLRDGVSRAVEGFMTKDFVLRRAEILACYRQLPDDFPRLSDIAERIYGAYEEAAQRNARQGGRTPEPVVLPADIQVQHLGRYRHPPLAVEQFDALFDEVERQGGREAFLAQVHLNQLSPAKAEEAKDRLFSYYLAHKPIRIAEQADRYADAIAALPPEGLRSVFTAVFSKATNDHELLARAAMVEKMRDLSGVLPDRDLVERAYADMASATRFPLEGFLAIVRVTAIPPPMEEDFLKKLQSRLRILQSDGIDRALELSRQVRGLYPPEKIQETPWTGWLERIEKLQGRTSNETYDPWSTDFKPLVKTASEKGLLDGTKAEDGEVLYEYVRQFGMKNLPTVFRWHAAIRRAPDVAAIPDDVRAELESTLRVKLHKLHNKGLVINEIKRFEKRMQEQILKDELPPGIDTPAGTEILKSIVGASAWSRNDSVPDLVRKIKETSERDPEAARLRPEFHEVALQVPLRERRRLSSEDQIAWEERRRAICEQGEVVLALEEVSAAFREAIDPEDVPVFFSAWRNDAIRRLDERSGAATSSDEGRRLDALGERLRDEPVPSPDEQGLARLISVAADVAAEVPGMSGDLRVLSAGYMRLMMPEARRRRVDRWFEGERQGKSIFPEEQIGFWSELVQQYISEHALNEGRAEGHGERMPLSPETRMRLREAWRLADSVERHPLCDAEMRLEGLDDKYGWKTSEKTVSVSLVPARGLLRTFAGDVADACYTSRHDELAEGKYGKLTAYVFVTGRGTPKERIRGSVLAIEAERPDGAPVLVVRANNPQESFIQRVDPAALVELTLGEMRKLGERLGVEEVVVPRDPASTSSSNRPAVSKHYRRRYAGSARVALKKAEETEFNGYPNWNAAGHHPVVSIGLPESARVREDSG